MSQPQFLVSRVSLILSLLVVSWGNARSAAKPRAPGMEALSNGTITGVVTDRDFYPGGGLATIDISLESGGPGDAIDGLLEVYVVPDGDPLGGGGGQEGEPIQFQTRVVQRPASPTGPVQATEQFLVSLPPVSWLYFVFARWLPAGAATFDPPRAVNFGVRPDLPGIPHDILTFAEVSIDMDYVRSRLKVGVPPVATGKCVEGLQPASAPSLEAARTNPIDDPGSSGGTPTPGCGWELRKTPQPVTLPLDAQRTMVLDLAPATFLSDTGVPEEAGVEFFQGTLVGLQGSEVRVTVGPDGIHATIQDTDGNSTEIEPLSYYVPTAAPDRHLVYRSEAVRLRWPSHTEPAPQGNMASPTRVDKSASKSASAFRSISPESHTLDSNLFRVMRLWVYKDRSSISSLHHLFDVAPIFERDLKIKIQAAFVRVLETDDYSNNPCGGDPPSFWNSFKDDTADDDWNFLNLDARILYTKNGDYDYGDTIGCGGPTSGLGGSEDRAAWVLHDGSSFQIRQVTAHELGHTLGASHDCTSMGTELHCWGCLFGGCIDCYTHNLDPIMCTPYDDDHAVARFSGVTKAEVLANAETLPVSMHYWSGSNAGGDGMSLKEFWMLHDTDLPGQSGWYKGQYSMENTSGALLGFWDFHFAFDPDSGAVVRVHPTIPVNVLDGLTLVNRTGFQDMFPGAGGWNLMEVWPSYRRDDGHPDHREHFGPANWNGLDFELER